MYKILMAIEWENDPDNDEKHTTHTDDNTNS